MTCTSHRTKGIINHTDEGEWVNAADLSIGELIWSLDGDYGTVEAVVTIDNANQAMYNLYVARG